MVRTFLVTFREKAPVFVPRGFFTLACASPRAYRRGGRPFRGLGVAAAPPLAQLFLRNPLVLLVEIPDSIFELAILAVAEAGR